MYYILDNNKSIFIYPAMITKLSIKLIQLEAG